nr:helix-turn-helix domain-containing protein [uncultured Oscillibacter sp.]
MRKHHIPFGLPRHNPRHYRFPLPNAVWTYQLKPMEFVILSYLYCHSSHGGTGTLSPAAIAKGAHKSESMIKKYLSVLAGAGLVTEQHSLAADFSSAGNGKFFTLPNEIFLLNLPPSAFVVYAYLLLVEDRRMHTCHPSYNTIAAITGMSRNTVIKSISVLLDRQLVTMEHSQYLDRRGLKWNGNNLYTILPMQKAVEAFHQRQLRQLEADAQRRKLRRQQERLTHNALLSTPASTGRSPAP